MAAIMSGKAAVRAVGIIVMGLLLVAIGMGDYTITAEQDSSSLVVRETIDPGRIFLKGLDRSPETARVTLTLEAPQGGRLPVDLVLVADRSATMDIPTVREAGREIIGLLGGQDRGALVSFANEANLDLGLTFDSEAVEQALERLRNEGKTGLGEGIAVATTELINNGRSDAIWVEVVLMEGRNNTGRDPIRQAEIAADSGIAIFTAGIGRYVPDQELLAEIAEITGGLFFRTFSDVAVEEIGARILQEVVAKDITVTKTLPSYINFEESFDPYPPDRVINEYDGATTLEWKIEELKVDESWEAEFEISSEEGGEVSINSGPSTVEFANSVGKRITMDIPAEEIEVEAPPQAEFDFSPSKPELGKTVTFDPADSTDPNGNIVSCEWDFGDDTDPRITSCDKVSHVYDRYGTFEVTLTVEDKEGLKDEATVPITIGERPLAEFKFTPEEPLTGETVTFDASISHDSDGHITSYEWDFGDGYRSTVTGAIIQHAFNSYGSFSVRLLVVDNDGFTGEKVKTIVVNEPPEVAFNFSPEKPEVQESVTFDACASHDLDGSIESYRWEFGDGSLETVENCKVEHVYHTYGQFTVTLTIKDNRGATAEAADSIKVSMSPTASFTFTPDDPTTEGTVTFDASESYDSDGHITSYKWDFGDGSKLQVVTSPVIHHSYDQAGTYSVKLTVTDDDGLTSEKVKTITINDPPTADFSFSPLSPTTQDTVQFTDESHDPDGEVDLWEWDFGDGSSSNEQNPSHRYADNGTFRVKLSVTDDRGATATASKLIAVANVVPTADFTVYPSSPIINQSVTFDASASHDPDGRITKYEWDFDGDGIFEAETESSTIERSFDTPGELCITLKVTDDDGAAATVEKTIEVLERLVSAYREIDTYLHGDKTLPGETFRVTVTIEVNMDLLGLGLDENLPDGWTVTRVDDAGATYHKGTVQWLFVKKVPAEAVKTIVYDVTVPSDAELGIYDINGNISSASPNFEKAVGGENQVEITDRLPVSWVVSRWDTHTQTGGTEFNIQLDDLITFDQIQQAVAWWLDGQTIENTGGAVIDLGTMEELVAYWLTDTPVYESLP